MEQLLENKKLQWLAQYFNHPPTQLNGFMEGDSELIRLSSGILAITIDSIVEEIEQKLYSDPFQIGWMTVMANLSDLAAVGASPIGLLLFQHLPKDLSRGFISKLQQGVQAACKVAETFILGGDTNQSNALQMGAAAVGWINDNEYILRKGCKKGDFLYGSDVFGKGNAYAFFKLFQPDAANPIAYQPIARLAEGSIVRQNGSACIDTSDGLFPALANLASINHCGFELDKSWGAITGNELAQLALQTGIPPWYFLAGPHGEFELLFTIPPQKETDFLTAAGQINWYPTLLGKVVEETTCSIQQNGHKKPFDPSAIANLFEQSEGNPRIYFQKLQKIKLL